MTDARPTKNYRRLLPFWLACGLLFLPASAGRNSTLNSISLIDCRWFYTSPKIVF